MLKMVFKIDQQMLNNDTINHLKTSSRSETQKVWNNEFLSKFPCTWYDPFLPNESFILFYGLALPTAYIADIFRVHILGHKRLPPSENKRFVNNRLFKDKEINGNWAPMTNTRFLAKYTLVGSWALLIFAVLGIFWLSFLLLSLPIN